MTKDVIFSFPFDSDAILFNDYLYYQYYSTHLKCSRNKETNCLEFKGDLFDIFSLGRIYEDWKYNKEGTALAKPEIDKVSHETLKPENLEKVFKICIAVDKIIDLDAKQVLELYRTLLENNL